MTTAVSRLPGSCIGGSSGPPVAAPGASACSRDLGALAGQRRGQDLVAVARARRRRAALAGAHDGHAVALVEAQQLREAAARARWRSWPATASVGLVSPRSTWESIGAETPLRSARSRSERSIPSRSARMRDPTDGRSAACAAIGAEAIVAMRVRYHGRLYTGSRALPSGRSRSATRSATWRSSRTSITARPRWWTRCCASPGSSRATRPRPTG